VVPKLELEHVDGSVWPPPATGAEQFETDVALANV
jgi:hypothetical protein